MRNQKRDDQNTSSLDVPTAPLGERDQHFLRQEIAKLQQQFKVKPHPDQAAFIALKFWEFEDNYRSLDSLKDIYQNTVDLTEKMVKEDDIAMREIYGEIINNMYRYFLLFYHILDNPCLFSYQR